MRPLLVGLAVLGLAAGGAEAKTRRPPEAEAVAACDRADHYVNVSGHCVHRPERARAQPPGATARCRDGQFSFSEHHRGTCSHHGGVAAWL